MSAADGGYYVPKPTSWPFLVAGGLCVAALGAVLALNGLKPGTWIAAFGAAVLAVFVFRWFARVIGEAEAGVHTPQAERAFRWAMAGFLLTQVALFAVLFAALLYARRYALPWIAANELLWPGFDAVWPSAGPNGPVALEPGMLPGPNQFAPLAAWDIPALNTLILFVSGILVTWAYRGLLRENRAQLLTGLFLTIACGLGFLALQAYSHVLAYAEFALTLKTGIYGATFFALTGFHALQALIAVIVLAVALTRAFKGQFQADRRFGLEAAVWYWHFVDAAWLFLFVFVYWL